MAALLIANRRRISATLNRLANHIQNRYMHSGTRIAPDFIQYVNEYYSRVIANLEDRVYPDLYQGSSGSPEGSSTQGHERISWDPRVGLSSLRRVEAVEAELFGLGAGSTVAEEGAAPPTTTWWLPRSANPSSDAGSPPNSLGKRPRPDD